MALCHKWDVKNGFTYVLQFFSLISDGLGGMITTVTKSLRLQKDFGPKLAGFWLAVADL